MNKIHAIPLAILCVVFAGTAAAADTPRKKRTRNQNRIGPYAAALIGQTNYTGDQESNEQELLDFLQGSNIPFQNLDVETDDSDLGYQLAFGYRFHRYFAGEIALVQYGELSSTASGQFDVPDDGPGFTPGEVGLAFNATGPLFSFLGILPMGEHFEAYGRVGYLFASVEREFKFTITGLGSLTGSAKGDSQNLVYGVGLSWNINQVYSIRAEYQKIDDLGQASRTGTEDLNVISLGMAMRF